MGPFYCLLVFLQMVKILMILMWLWVVDRKPSSGMLLSITSAIP